MNDTSIVPSRYVHDTFNRYTNDTWPSDRKYGNLVHVRYIDDTKTIQKDDTYRFRYVYDTGQKYARYI